MADMAHMILGQTEADSIGKLSRHGQSTFTLIQGLLLLGLFETIS